MEDSRDQLFPGAPGSEHLHRLILEFDSFRDFIQIFSPMVSEAGMFVPAEFLEAGAPAVGETVDFEVRLSDDFRLVNGRGEIAWRRGGADGGLGVRFLDLDEPSKRLVARLVSNFVKDGGQPFDVEAGAAEASAEVEQEPEARTPVEPEHLGAIEADELFAAPDLPEVEVPEEVPLVGEASAEPFAGASEPLEESILPELGADSAPDERQRLQIPDFELDASPPEPPPPPAAEPAVKGAAPMRSVISRDIARVAEELSGRSPVPPVEMPTEEERTAVYSGASTTGGGRSWRTFALASIAGIALGVAAWFLADDSLKGFFGLAPEEPVAVAAAPAPGERPGARTEPVAERSAAESPPPPAVGAGQAEEPVKAAGTGARRESAEAPQRAGAAAREAAAAQVASEPDPTEKPVAVEARKEAAVPADTAAEVVSAATSVAEQAASGPRASAVESVTWRAEGGATIVTVRFDGSLRSEDLEVLQLREGAPREVIKLRGISSPMVPPEVAIDSAQVVRLRSGLHEVGGRSELHLVVDLARPDAQARLERRDGRTLVITFS